MEMKSYKQSDPRWAEQTLKPSEQTMRRVGCLVTDVADLSSHFGDNLDPGQVCRHLRFTKGALLIWASANFRYFKFDHRQYGRNDKEISAALADPDRAVILQVNNGAHWVVATGWHYLWRRFKIADPWYGNFGTMRRYRNNITGAAYFRRKPNAEPAKTPCPENSNTKS